ncbi:MAG: hypothetical protein JRN06_08250 [Nitrososphaerota archaeon]|nr:hypothetical protein [Nitrososphaerota archaeon]MDG7024226.1 hypothetical protein [Nitrososphaerota archaeon]
MVSRLGSRSRFWALALLFGIVVVFVIFGSYGLLRGYLYGLWFLIAGIAIGIAALHLPGTR